MNKLAISIGDINGISCEILIKAHNAISKICTPYYFIHPNLLSQALKILNLTIDNYNLVIFEKDSKEEFFLKEENKHYKIFCFKSALYADVDSNFDINVGKIDAKSGLYSYLSFQAANYFVKAKYAKALITLPIHKKAWQLAHIPFRGHTEALRFFYKKEAIMMLGCSKLFVGLFSDHIPLKEVSKKIQFKSLVNFFINFYKQTHFKKIGVLGFNPHAGDYGVIGGKEEEIINKAIEFSNAYLSFLKTSTKQKNTFLKKFNITEKTLLQNALKNEILKQELLQFNTHLFYLPQVLVADTAFTKNSLKSCNRLIAMYHDLGLAPLKALYFDQSINISLNLPIIRTSVDHGTAFDIAYKHKAKIKSYKEAIKFALYLNHIKNDKNGKL
ncbi:4-hydroxythreonine-4-phosphate dehydrogenase [Campylobacter novaezeelandiae]|uniref:4-hydroxythreonine-4-phosphate dehydrogenase n=1 Tax=Campylobacter novaezeelandiae TaxID=2267891 RepID=UPI0019071BC3|nr:4-hydroxythreonine-4-phosphate dehydrogenase [Campylobacter novaezeelandiae]MBK1963600.1 4-hydroxythreonine-4-phosphate dehydrogenase [Campylobacter novaezeelandiae]MBK1993586.1 4-hydroxythreonine-4-phosphate dehydrogenase [Campylobacter novaezeelandiae]